MLKRFLFLQPHVRSFLADQEWQKKLDSKISNAEWSLMEKVVKVLRVFYEATVWFSSASALVDEFRPKHESNKEVCFQKFGSRSFFVFKTTFLKFFQNINHSICTCWSYFDPKYTLVASPLNTTLSICQPTFHLWLSTLPKIVELNHLGLRHLTKVPPSPPHIIFELFHDGSHSVILLS